MNKQFDPKLPVATRDGKPVRILCTDRKGPFCLAGLTTRAGEETPNVWTAEGKFHSGPDEHPDDLVNRRAVFERSVWINVFDSQGMIFAGDTPHASRAEADFNAGLAGLKRWACVSFYLRCQEGDGL